MYMNLHHCIYANIMLRLALMYQLRCHGAKLTPGEAQVIESLLKLIDKFQLQADTVVR